ncbi:Lrp/AsnC family transcriptional regulator [Natrinema salifodinae]|uniref:Transcriptional regulator, AsnC family n=1 Tax=Natrinema salifodinae TaxID=1202768 RepID=A0A1I0Q867_9EURY|nr:AsnC family transcriptional regulator [Natrinema salifodinae]SEW22979.1 transcriptional regulator, AsnC family [Natrinema salifodinae]
MVHNLDDVDRGILHALQGNAREATAADMGDMVGTSASTVRNRIDYLEENVIRGYHPELNYEAAGFDLHLFIVCRAPTAKRTELAKEALELSGVINVRELTTGSHNIHIEAMAVDTDAADETRAGIENLDDLEIVSTQIINDLHVQPFNHFGADVVED